MKTISPSCSDTIVTPDNEWLPNSFKNFLLELDTIIAACKDPTTILFRGHAKRAWLLDSMFTRSCKAALFGIRPETPLPEKVRQSIDYHRVVLNMFLLKYGVLARPSQELVEISEREGLDAWFEFMKRLQQFPEEDPCYLRGTNILDWSKSKDVALYFANDKRMGEGALWICDAAATGKTLQILQVGAILDKMNSEGNKGKPLGTPLLFCPLRQLRNVRANNQHAIYFAQMDLRCDFATLWQLQEKNLNGERIVVKLVLPQSTQASVGTYLKERGMTDSYIYPRE